jgi:hypothetical protein
MTIELLRRGHLAHVERLARREHHAVGVDVVAVQNLVRRASSV